jgi:hypothetical protein
MLVYKDKCHWELLLFISPFPLNYIGAAIVFPWHVSGLLIIEPTESETKVNTCNFSLTDRHGLCNFLAVLLGVAWLNLLSFHVDFLPVPTYWTLHVSIIAVHKHRLFVTYRALRLKEHFLRPFRIKMCQGVQAASHEG